MGLSGLRTLVCFTPEFLASRNKGGLLRQARSVKILVPWQTVIVRSVLASATPSSSRGQKLIAGQQTWMKPAAMASPAPVTSPMTQLIWRQPGSPLLRRQQSRRTSPGDDARLRKAGFAAKSRSGNSAAFSGLTLATRRGPRPRSEQADRDRSGWQYNPHDFGR